MTIAVRQDSLPDAVSPLGALRARRLARRVQGLDRFDVFYQAYVTALISGMAVLVLSDWVGGTPVSTPAGELAARGTAVLGLVTAAAVAAGLRSGSRGGPLAIEPPDIRHVLLAPVGRDEALRAPALRQLRFLLAAAVAVGAAGGQLAARRLPGSMLAWMASGAMWAVVTVALTVGVAWLAAGRRMPTWIATGLATLLLAAAAAEVAGVLPTAPTHWAGALGVLPAHVDPWSWAVPVAAVALAAWALRGLGGTSVERLSRRSALVGELRFAATMRDLRTVMLVRRQLHQEAPRTRPWLRTRRRGGHTVVVLRDWRALQRTPVPRLVRLVVLSTVAALSAVGIWLGTPALVIVAGLCAFLAALEALEPLAQEVDRCTVLDLAPVDKGAVLVRHLIVPVTALVVVALTIAGLVLPFTSSPEAVVVLATTALVAPAAAVAGAAINVRRDGTGPGAQAIEQLMLPPEAVGMRLVYKLAFPPALAAAGFAPVLLARQAVEGGTDPAHAATSIAVLVALAACAVAAWVRHRDGLSDWWATATQQATSTTEGAAG
ncbi:MAG TPA: hypothetical protein VFU14_17320 [Acidimicrobiales bacterium]|nr:hypothetical protein [Acidimicrobiales bacterium]